MSNENKQEENVFAEVAMENKEQISENEFAQTAPAQTSVPPMAPQGEQLSSGNAGNVYDFNAAPDSVKSPDRLDIDGQVVDIIKAEIIIPPESQEWKWSKKKTVQTKACPFKIHMKTKDGQLQIENYSGVTIFKQKDGKAGHPTIWKEGSSQAAGLMNLYAVYTGKDIAEVTLKQFGNFLNSGIKGKIVAQEVKHYETNEKFNKNFIGLFVK